MLRTSIVEKLNRAPKVIVVAAPEGYDKLRTMRQYAAQQGSFSVCTLTPVTHRSEAYGLVIDALAAANAELQTDAASARLQSGTGVNVAVLRDAWKRRPTRSHMLIIRDAG